RQERACGWAKATQVNTSSAGRLTVSDQLIAARRNLGQLLELHSEGRARLRVEICLTHGYDRACRAIIAPRNPGTGSNDSVFRIRLDWLRADCFSRQR